MPWSLENATLGTLGVGAAASTTVALVTSVTVGSGRWIILGIGWFDTAGTYAPTVSVSDNGPGLTWTAQRSTEPVSLSAIAYAYAPSGMASGTTITATISRAPSDGSRIQGASFVGTGATAVAAGVTYQSNSETSSFYFTSDVGTVTKTNTLVVSLLRSLNPSGTATHAPVSPTAEAFEFASPRIAGGNVTVVLAYRTDGRGGEGTAGFWTAVPPSTALSLAIEAGDSTSVSRTGLRLATTQSVDVLTGTAWSNQSNALADSDTEATESVTAKNTPVSGTSTTGWMKLGNYGFDAAVPSGATVVMVEVRVRWRMNSAAGVGNRDWAWSLSGTRGSSDHALTTEPTLALETYTADVTTERSWTRADLLDGVFEVHVRGRNGNSTSDPSYRFAWAKTEVVYSTAAAEEPKKRIRNSNQVAVMRPALR